MRERYESIQYLKKEIRQWVEAAVSANLDQLDDKGRLDYPAFILIDELDRCRPSYAVEMLETIKHIFDISGVVFVQGEIVNILLKIKNSFLPTKQILIGL
ncbi:KAP family NTPase [Aeromonas caviae]|uniref:P-loop NTPase fold protein n=1 Tax=Aeromonas caviae TaxID=648 RepID=UPI0024C8FA0F|nr:KAP family NTPase [Aeromonas caviae]WAF62416.1 KAP family NTPase [Aeromonas caviae]WAF79254.1 KAP family NTPase [Aeromonas caviae]